METYSPHIPATLSKPQSISIPVPWYIYAALIATVSIFVGLVWDVSWHMSIGRDSLFSAPHLVIYLGGVLGGIGGAYQLFSATFSKNPGVREKTVWFWGFRAPLGALFAIWGALAMLTSAPFDDWWHNAYGLDVKILSPPHALLAMGLITVQVGSMITLLSFQNQIDRTYATTGHQPWKVQIVRHMFPLTVGMILCILNILFWEYMSRNDMHSATFYKIGSIIFPLFLVASGSASNLKWPMTYASLWYLLVYAGMNWILPLFPAEPRLGPIHNTITHYVPLEFPFLIFVPAIAMDFILQQKNKSPKWLTSVYLGIAFFSLFFVVQWFFSIFLMSPAARNWFFFADGALPYYANPNWKYRYDFYLSDDNILAFLKGLGFAISFAILSARIGLSWGNWMKQVRR